MNPRKRVLFVDDDPMILEGLQRSFRPARAEWDVCGAPGGPEALELMARSRVDEVVSDIPMPVMNGAEFFAEVMRLHPQTVRMALSGHADQTPPSDRLQQLVSRLERLPTPPALCDELLRMIRQPDTNLQDISEGISRDAAITAGILKSVNPAFFGLALPVSNTFQAVENLGIEAVRSLAWTVRLFDGFAGRLAAGTQLNDLEGPSYRTAAAASAITLAEGAPRAHVEEAIAGGLLHDAGKLVLGAVIPDEHAEVLRVAPAGDRALCDVEMDLLGATHADVGAYLLGLWGLPPAMPVRITELRVGQVFASPVETPDGTLLVASHTKVTSLLLERLRSFSRSRGLREPPFVEG